MNLEQKEKLIKYFKKFKKHDYFIAVNFTLGFIKMREKVFRSVEPEDFVMIVIEKFFDGRRKYDDTDYRQFKKSFYYSLRSELRNYFTLNAKALKNEDIDQLYEIAEIEDFGTSENVFYEDQAEIIFMGIDEIELKSALMEIITDENEKEILDQFLTGKSNIETAEATGINVSEIENAKKRIFRSIRNKLDKEFLEGKKTWAA